MKTIEEPIRTSDDVQFCREQIKQTIESFNNKKAPAIGGITGGIYLRTFNIFHRPVTAIYNKCLKGWCFPKTCKITKITPTIKPRKENSADPAKCRPISILNIGGKVLEKLLINRIKHHMYKNNQIKADNLDSRHIRVIHTRPWRQTDLQNRHWR